MTLTLRTIKIKALVDVETSKFQFKG